MVFPLMRKLVLLLFFAACKTGAPARESESPPKSACHATLGEATQGCSLRAELSESQVLVKFLKCGQSYDACGEKYVCTCPAK
jgi:hypothetical protein